MKTSNKKVALPLSRFQKFKLFSIYPVLAIQAIWCIVKIDTFTIDWRLVPLVLFIIAGVTHAIGIAYYYKYAKERETKRFKMGNRLLSTANVVALIGFYFMMDIFRF